MILNTEHITTYDRIYKNTKNCALWKNAKLFFLYNGPKMVNYSLKKKKIETGQFDVLSIQYT